MHLIFFHVVRNEWEKYSAGAIVMKLFFINSHLFLPLCLNSVKILSSFYDVENYFNCCWMRGRGKKKLKKFSTEIKEIFTFIPYASYWNSLEISFLSFREIFDEHFPPPVVMLRRISIKNPTIARLSLMNFIAE